MDKKQALKDYV